MKIVKLRGEETGFLRTKGEERNYRKIAKGYILNRVGSESQAGF